MSTLVQRAQEIRARLMNPPNAIVEPKPIDRVAEAKAEIKVISAELQEALTYFARLESKIRRLTDRYRELQRSSITAYPKVDEVLDAVCFYYRVLKIDVKSARRDAPIIRPRQVAMYLAKKLTLASLPQIGVVMGGRDHTTVLHGVRKIEGLLQSDAVLANDVEEIRKVFVASPKTEDAPCSSAQTAAQ